MQEESSQQLKSQIEATSDIFKEKQNEIITLEKKLSKLSDKLNEGHVELEKFDHTIMEKQ